MEKTIKFRSIGLVVTGVLAIAFGISIISKWVPDYNYYLKIETYGGQAYTGIQNAAACTGFLVREGIDVMQLGFMFLFFLIGLLCLSVGLPPLCYKNNSQN